MTTHENQLQNVATILRNWKGSDAAEEASPNAVAADIDQAYDEYLASLRQKTVAIGRGQNEWERKAA